MATTTSTKTILWAGFIAGTADISGAIIVYSLILGKVGVIQLLQSIATGIFGKEAYAGGIPMALCGLFFHYIIATLFALGYFLVFPFIPFLRQQKTISGLLYGVLVWFIMNLVVRPLSNATSSPFKPTVATFRDMAILMVCIGLPISLIVYQYYSLKTRKR